MLEKFEILWRQAANTSAYENLFHELKSLVVEYSGEDREPLEESLLKLLGHSNVAGLSYVLEAMLELSALDLKNKELIDCILEALAHECVEVRRLAVSVAGRASLESERQSSRYLPYLLDRLDVEADPQCRNRLFVNAQCCVEEVKRILTGACLREVQDDSGLAWRAMFVLEQLQEHRVRWREWDDVFATVLQEMPTWNDLKWSAFCSLLDASDSTTFQRSACQVLPDLMRISGSLDMAQDPFTRSNLCRTLLKVCDSLGRHKKKVIVAENATFFETALIFDDSALCVMCLDLFLELSIVPLLKADQRIGLLDHDDDVVRARASELFDRGA